MGLMQGLAQTGTTLLEPMLQVRITVPEVYGGKVLSDLVQMRASFDPPQLSGDRFVVEGRLPVATSLDYPVKLSAMSGGRGVITSSFGGYQPSPPDVHAERKRRGVNRSTNPSTFWPYARRYQHDLEWAAALIDRWSRCQYNR